MLAQLLRTTGMTTLDASPLWDRADLSSDDLLAEYQRECGIVRRGINGDLTKVRFLLSNHQICAGAILLEILRLAWAIRDKFSTAMAARA